MSPSRFRPVIRCVTPSDICEGLLPRYCLTWLSRSFGTVLENGSVDVVITVSGASEIFTPTWLEKMPSTMSMRAMMAPCGSSKAVANSRSATTPVISRFEGN